MKKRWFRKDIKVYDVLEISDGKFWSDSSYGNGGGSYISFEKEQILHTFDTFLEADSFRQEMENSAKNRKYEQ